MSLEKRCPSRPPLLSLEDLYDHLLWQLKMLDLEPEQREIAELVIGNLDEDGFLAATIEELQLLGAEPNQANAYRAWLAREAAKVEAEEKEEAARENGEAVVEAAQTATDAEKRGHQAPLDAVGNGASSLAATAQVGVDEIGSSPSEPVGSTLQLSADDSSEESFDSVPGYSNAAVQAAIEVVKTLDPPGVGCGSLRESLLFQLRALGEEDTVTYQLISEYWDLCLRRQFPAIAKDMGVHLQDLKEPSERIAQLETRPGRKYGGERTHYVEPDVYVVNVGGEFVVQINDDGLPKLRVSRAYRDMLRQMKAEGSDGDAQVYIKDKMRSAMWLIKSLDQRQRTIYKVAESIVKQQHAFFVKGIEYLRPMVLRDVAEDIEMHESTVSRVVSNKYIHTPRGLHPMKFFFHSGIDRDMGGDISSLSVKRKIKHMIDAEDPKKPLSDSTLMNRLKSEGIQIARRTVAKYRDELRIPSSTDRKQVF